MKRFLLILVLFAIPATVYLMNKEKVENKEVVKETPTKTASNSPTSDLVTKTVTQAEPKTSPLTEQEIKNASFHEAKMNRLKQLNFPTGNLIQRKILDKNSHVEIFRTERGDEITNIYYQGVLTSEKWDNKKDWYVIRSYENERLFAITEQNQDKSFTLFYDSNSLVSKSIEEIGKKRTCIKYDSSGVPYAKSEGPCQDDDYREFEDIRE